MYSSLKLYNVYINNFLMMTLSNLSDLFYDNVKFGKTFFVFTVGPDIR